MTNTRIRPRTRHLEAGIAAIACSILAASCGSGPTGSAAAPADNESEPNNDFSEAHKAIFSAEIARLTGTIDNRDDLDVFDLGPLSAGDRLIVDLDSITENLDPSIALFDASFNIFMDNDDENLETLRLDPYINELIRHDAETYYLVVGRSAFGGLSAESGQYRVTVRVEPANPVPKPKAQV